MICFSVGVVNFVACLTLIERYSGSILGPERGATHSETVQCATLRIRSQQIKLSLSLSLCIHGHVSVHVHMNLLEFPTMSLEASPAGIDGGLGRWTVGGAVIHRLTCEQAASARVDWFLLGPSIDHALNHQTAGESSVTMMPGIRIG